MPTDAEFTDLTDFLDGASVAGGPLKETGTAHWNNPNTGATNSSGFTALPGGYRSSLDGSFPYISSYGYWWSSSASSTSLAWYRLLYYNYSNVYGATSFKKYGFSVRCVLDAPPSYPPGTVHCDPSNPTAIVEVTNPITGKIWMDRNLGAAQVATSSTDSASYGDLYQWGRFADGHQCRTSGTTTSLSSSDVPGHGSFISAPNSPYDWRSPQNMNLWQVLNGVNNPCPTGYGLPTEVELNAERLSWSSSNAAGAFASQLKLPMAGLRGYSDGSFDYVGSLGGYWSSTVSGAYSRIVIFDGTSASMYDGNRAVGLSVRCIKDL